MHAPSLFQHLWWNVFQLNMLMCVTVCDCQWEGVWLCVTVSVVCPHYRFGVIVYPRVRRCSPAQQEAIGGVCALIGTTDSPQ